MTFNTIQPSAAEAERGRAVYNWLTLANNEAYGQKFRCVYYNMSGKELKRTTVTVAPYQRQDIDGGHGVAGFNTAGSIVITPENALARYLSVMVRYGSLGAPGSGVSGYNFAYPILADVGSAATQYIPLNAGSEVQEIVELSNVSGKGGDLLLKKLDSAGKPLGSNLRVTLGSRNQQHFRVTDLLGAAKSGTLVVESVGGSLFNAAVTSFYQTADNAEIVAAARMSSIKSNGMELSSSYNLYLQMDNWLRVINPTKTKQKFVLELDTPSGIKSFTKTISAASRLDFPLHSTEQFGTALNTYGVLKIIPPSGGSLSADLLRLRQTATTANPADPANPANPANPADPDFAFTVPLR